MSCVTDGGDFSMTVAGWDTYNPGVPLDGSYTAVQILGVGSTYNITTGGMTVVGDLTLVGLDSSGGAIFTGVAVHWGGSSQSPWEGSTCGNIIYWPNYSSSNLWPPIGENAPQMTLSPIGGGTAACEHNCASQSLPSSLTFAYNINTIPATVGTITLTQDTLGVYNGSNADIAILWDPGSKYVYTQTVPSTSGVGPSFGWIQSAWDQSPLCSAGDTTNDEYCPDLSNSFLLTITDDGFGSSFGLGTGGGTAPAINGAPPFVPILPTPGAVLLVRGSGFTGLTSLTVDGNPTPFTVISDTLLRTYIPTTVSAGSRAVVVTNANGSDSRNVSVISTPAPQFGNGPA